jgi:hypothetical protein
MEQAEQMLGTVGNGFKPALVPDEPEDQKMEEDDGQEE